MGIYDRDWYKDKHRDTQKAKQPSKAERKPSSPRDQFTTDQPLIKRVAVRRATYERWLRSQDRGWPVWLIALFWVLIALLIFAVMRLVSP